MARQATASASGSTGGVKSVGALVAVVALALVVLVLLSARPQPEPFDPRSAQPSGARGLVITLRSAGANVIDSHDVPDIAGAAGPNGVRVLVLDDRLSGEQRDALLDFVQAGGVAVVADPESSLHGGSGIDGGAIEVTGSAAPVRSSVEFERTVAPGRCTIGALEGLRGVFVPDGVLFPVGPDELQCFTEPIDAPSGGDASHSFVIVRSIGAGFVVGLGDNEPFVNRNLRNADNAGLMVALLAPDGDGDVVVLVGDGPSQQLQEVGSGDETLRDLVPTWAWMVLVVGAIAFVVFAISRSVRPGRILTEPIGAPIAGSELISATGNLMQRAHHVERAGWLLTDRLHRDLCAAFGSVPSAPLGDLDQVVAAHADVARGEVEAVLRTVVNHELALTALATAVASIRRRAIAIDGLDLEHQAIQTPIPTATRTSR